MLARLTRAWVELEDLPRRAQVGRAYLWFGPSMAWALAAVFINSSEFPAEAGAFVLASTLIVVLPSACVAVALSLRYWREWPLPALSGSMIAAPWLEPALGGPLMATFVALAMVGLLRGLWLLKAGRTEDRHP